MRVFRRFVSSLIAFLAIAGSCHPAAAQGGAVETLLLSGARLQCAATDASSRRVWPCTVQFSGSANDVNGEINWTTLSSVHRIKGSISGNTLRFTEVSAVRAGAAHLNVAYVLSLSASAVAGTWVDPADNSRGSMSIDVSAVGASGALTRPEAPAFNGALDGSWNAGLLHVWQEGERLLVTAYWRRGSDGRRMMFKADGRIQGRQVTFFNLVMSPQMYGPTPGRIEYFLTVSADGREMDGTWTIDGKRSNDSLHYVKDP